MGVTSIVFKKANRLCPAHLLIKKRRTEKNKERKKKQFRESKQTRRRKRIATERNKSLGEDM